MRTLTDKRRKAIIDALGAGSAIRTGWCGSQGNGYVKYTLHGVLRLREMEVEALEKERVIVRFGGQRHGDFGSFRLRTPDDDQAETENKQRIATETAKRERETQEHRARMNKLGIFLVAADLRVGLPTTNIIHFEFQGHEYQIHEVDSWGQKVKK